MWIYLNDAMLSIVADRKAATSSELIVRARRAGDIERVFPNAVVAHTPANDYPFRTRVQRYEVASAIGERLVAINYPNFKNSVPDDARHDVYGEVWKATQRLSQRADRTPARPGSAAPRSSSAAPRGRGAGK